MDHAARRRIAAGVGVCVLVAVAVAFWLRKGEEKPQAARPAGVAEEAGPAATADQVLSGTTVAKTATGKAKDALQDKQVAGEPWDCGQTKPVKGDANPQVRSVSEALRDKKHPERFSAMIAPAAFDAKAFQADPEKYLNTIEPGRVFQTAQPGPGVTQLQQLGGGYHEAVQEEIVPLRVKVPAGSPVTFTSFDLGAFENRLTSITVQADKQGVAEAKFRGTSGTMEEVHILAACPQASGQARFIVYIQQASATANPVSGGQ